MAEAGDGVTNLEEIDAEWLSTTLDGPPLDGVEQRSIGTGQVGENVRFRLSWSDVGSPTGTGLPSSVVGKFPSLDETSRATAAATGSYVKEIGFYRDLQSSVTIRTPRLFRLEEDLDNNNFLLLMEDITPAVQGDQIAGCDPAQAELAVRALAGLHQPHWGAPPALDWLTPRSAERGEELAAFYLALAPGFCDRYRGRLAPDVLDTVTSLGPLIEAWYVSFATAPTITHGDYRLDNLLFGTGTPAPPLTVVDWQTVAIGHGPIDVAYFVGAGLLPEVRRHHEDSLFDAYVDALHDRTMATADTLGLVDDRTTLWRDYRLGAASGLVMAVVASMIVGQTTRGDEMFCVMAERHADQMRSLDTFSLVGEA